MMRSRLTFLAAYGVFAAGSIQAEGEGDSDLAVLTWKNSETLAGELVGADQSGLTWKSELFANPIEISRDYLQSFKTTAETVMPEQQFAVDLLDGGRFFGDLIALDANFLSLTSKSYGDLTIRREAIREIRRVSGAKLIWSGPFGVAAWKFEKKIPDPVSAPRWMEAKNGALRNVVWGDPAKLLLDFPDQFEFEIRLETLDRPEFSLQIAAAKRSITIETWDDDLVVRLGDQFRRILSLKDEDRLTHLRVFWDTKSDRGLVCKATGEQLAEWDDLGSMGGSEDAVMLTNKGAGLDVTLLRVREWNGEKPTVRESAAAEGIGLELVDGSMVKKEPEALESGIVRVPGQQIPLDRIQSLRLAEAEAETPAENTILVRLTDTTRFQGSLTGADGELLRFETKFADEALEIDLDHVVEMNFPTEPSDQVDLEKLDSLVLDEATVRGTWVPAAGGTIRWQVPGSTDAVEIAADFREEASVERSNSAGKWPTAEALFHLASREIGAGELVSITEDGEVVQVRSEYFELAKLDQESLSAVVFKPVQIKPRGFSDPGWRVLSEDPKLVTIQKTAAGKVTIKPGGSIGHAAFLQGNRIEFKLHDVERYSTLKVRLFCADPEDVGGSTDLVFFYYNDRIYIAQQIRGQRGVRNQQQVNISPGSAVPVSIEWDDKMTKATINGVVLEIPKNDEAPRGGRGVVFEPGDMWNNGLRAVAFSHLKLEREPGFTWSPPVSAEVKEKALFIPRFRAERPQRHALFAANGDVLRGTIETATASQIAFRSGLETMTIGRDRVAAAIWLKPAEEEADADDEPAAEPVEGEADADDEPAAEPETSDETGHWIILGNGARFHLTVDDFGPEFLAGRSDLLGKCQLPVDQIYAISPTTPNVDPASLAFADWRLKKAPFPRIPGNEGDSEGSMEGQDAPEFSLKNLDGNAIEFDEDAPKIVVLDFWATWCGPCHRSMPELIEAVAEFPKKDVRLIAVNQGEAAARIQEFLEAREWGDLEVALDQNQSVGTQFQVEGIPHVVVIGTDGKIALVETGYRPGGSEAVGNVIRQLLEVESQ